MPIIFNQLQCIESSLKHKIGFTEIPVQHTLYQTPATDEQIYELRKHGSRYFVFNHSSNTMCTANGVYIYVIRVWDPGRVYCAPIGTIGGHTSLTRDDQLSIGNVLYAGELLFEQGKLKCWNNGSGHYRPDAGLVKKNLMKHISLMLPEHLFRETTIGRVLGYENA